MQSFAREIMLVRHLLAVAALPFVVAVIVPYWIIGDSSASHGDVALLITGAVLALAGVALFVSSLYEFATRGKGTLAPWDPPRHLVIRGPYRYVRNPMITGVVLILLAEAAVFSARPVFNWAVIFFIINAVYIPLLEEPMLKQRFGDEYTNYCRNVPRLIPRLRAWNEQNT